MQITDDAISLIKNFEGFRAEAYRCPAGIWTVGYGHTSMAGAPRVRQGMVVTLQEAEGILRRDVDAVAQDVVKVLRVALESHQFSALVSFCFNVGAVNFAKSSVLEAVNRRDFDAVPRRLALWVKAQGRTLPGLIRRRAAEAAMFAGGSDAPAKTEGRVEGKPPARSTSILATLVIAALSGVQAALGDASAIVAVLLLVGICAAALWIVRERINKSRKDGV